ncbi:HAMP domain-containing sensor histidine kinase [Pseudodesulfovibrio sp.]|uniref:sensor histidine kinase n=1 Tax=Pseudodesulfovibrio sp. TaxID=2035812 RepID=UPI0026298D5A|nr:HAMP domain-containing sensor histidine kinase [Pseudodesulfovibrio sp.]MDD3311669.1 HAMP domain-containing sensor histidine kinase [Pseudodesulfovibrio sp.]
MTTPDDHTANRRKRVHGQDFPNREERCRYVVERIEEKLDDYDGYDFSLRQVRALNIFFDLAQEFRGREMFYAVCLMLPRALFGLESRLYLLEAEDTFVLAGCSAGDCELERTRTWDAELSPRIVDSNGSLFIPIPCNPEYADLLSFVPPHNILGCFELYPCGGLEPRDRLFLEKYVNRIGYQLHQRIIRAHNREHLSFIKSMVQDIGHNVIVPNMYFKLYFNRLKRRIEELHVTTEKVLTSLVRCGDEAAVNEGNRLAVTAAAIEAQYQEIYRHYETTSMFLETLLRRRHFEEGRYVLVKRSADLLTGVIEPQIERYRQRLEERGIEIGCPLDGEQEPSVRFVMDRGLISQVFANLVSNAVKYTEIATLPDGRTGKFMTYGWRSVPDAFGPGRPGVRLWLTTSGKPLDLANPMDVFRPGFRAPNVAHEQGTGRGLYFCRQVVELHGGSVGYSHNDCGNEFYFLLPDEKEEGATQPLTGAPVAG